MRPTPRRMGAIAMAVACSVTAVAAPLDLETAVAMSLEADNQSAILRRHLDDQLADLGLRGYLDDISLRLAGSVRGDADTAASGSGSAGLSAATQIIPQLVLTGGLSASGTLGSTGAAGDPLSATVGLTLSPLADPAGRARAELAAEATATDLAVAQAAAANGAVGALIDAVNAHLDLDLRAAARAVAERSLANVEALHERDRATDQQLAAQRESLRGANQHLMRAELASDRATETLAQRIGVSASTIELPTVESLDLDPLVSRAAQLAQSANAANLAAAHASVLRASHDVRSAQLDLDSTYRFTPHLSISAEGSVPGWQYELGAELSVSPSDWDGAARREAEVDLAYARTEHSYTLRIAELDAHAAIEELRFSLEDLESDGLNLVYAEQDLAESEFRFAGGDITELALDEAKLAVLEAETQVHVSRLEVVRRLFAIEYGQY